MVTFPALVRCPGTGHRSCFHESLVEEGKRCRECQFAVRKRERAQRRQEQEGER